MRVLDLSGHYQRRVEIDTCPHCCLVWFDDTESVRLAGAGITGFLRQIHAAMQAGGDHAHAVSLARVQSCPVCGAALKPVFNMTRFGRTSQLDCPHGHGYYQTYILYLAEKGFVRPLAWADIRSLLAAGKELFCADCGFPLPNRPVEACPACQSAVGVIDPARLAIATYAADGGAIVRNVATGLNQHKCHACGGAVDLTHDIKCPHCHAPALSHDVPETAAAAVTEAPVVPTADQRRQAAAGRSALSAAQLAMVDFSGERSTQRQINRAFRIAIGMLVAAIAFGVIAWNWHMGQPVNGVLQVAPVISYSPRFRDDRIECDLHSAVRREVRVRQLIVTPGTPGPGQAIATYGATRMAYQRAITVRNDWKNGIDFELLEPQFSNPYATPRSMPPGFFRRGEALAAVERVAFCLPVREISPPVLAEDGFHLIEVLEVR
ncbi:PPIC-type PPIASE domain-containing protein [Duganella sp. CF458]|uniref:peptidylprolyl isomerase n=1 Tax=Duganella sp. CF458 TaxID=1884368 RepID=UPI0008E8B2CA|nr:peptidylprolyl isomerase [Duganella sp. CF458]SFG64280.1 PPIC-type PPIASE domain-containing protein [Duganella sp. CF458]